jgi:hypothetical protein
MRNGSYIRALGRHSFEPSQPASDADTSGSSTCEQSQEMQRRLIKAQNDVLATIGVCLRDTKHSHDLSESIKQENEVGLLVGAVDLTVTYLASWPLVGIRNRLQVCILRHWFCYIVYSVELLWLMHLDLSPLSWLAISRRPAHVMAG